MTNKDWYYYFWLDMWKNKYFYWAGKHKNNNKGMIYDNSNSYNKR